MNFFHRGLQLLLPSIDGHCDSTFEFSSIMGSIMVSRVPQSSPRFPDKDLVLLKETHRRLTDACVRCAMKGNGAISSCLWISARFGDSSDSPANKLRGIFFVSSRKWNMHKGSVSGTPSNGFEDRICREKRRMSPLMETTCAWS